jgi:hypothetical protein
MKFNLKKIPKNVWLLIVIIAVAIFLRTYEFHDWLTFERDQARDAMMVSDVLEGGRDWPLLGATMKDSQDKEGNLFSIGPIYYHMQIISAKIFGNHPDKLAYPDLFFSIMSIPLFYIFLRKYFSINISLALSGIYSISFFAITYSRFAWNPNIIPFFTLLFLLSLWEFLIKKEKVEWYWVIFCGLSMGIGVQLHIILLLLFPTMTFLVFLYLLKINWRTWKIIIIVLLIFVLANTAQFLSEYKTGFSNLEVLYDSVSIADPKGKGEYWKKISANADCHLEANAYMLSSAGKNKCNFPYAKILKNDKSSKLKNEIRTPFFILSIVLASVFSALGYVFLIRGAWFEKERGRRVFLQLLVLYLALSFLVMIPVIDSDHTEFRYFIHTFFVPFVFLGFVLNFLLGKMNKKNLIIVFLIFSFLIFLNLNSIQKEANQLWAKNKNDDHFSVLGEVKLMADFILDNSSGKEIYLTGSDGYMSTHSKGLEYLTKKQGVGIINLKEGREPPQGKSFFFIAKTSENPEGKIKDWEVDGYEFFGRVMIYKLKNND